MTSSPALVLSTVFALALLTELALRFWLASRQARHVARHRDAVPAPFAATIGVEAHRKAADYTLAKTRLSLLEIAGAAALVLAWTLLGGLDALNRALLTLLGPGMAQQLALLGAFALIGSVLDAPLALYRTFGLEQRFGFNKMTIGLWLQDQLKAGLLALLIGLPLAALVLWVMDATGRWWWLWAWGIWAGFNLLFLVIYPTLIAPLFNKFQPLEDEALKTRVTALMQRCGFSAKGLFVMDGSRRSAHANAYFTGFGAAKRVVFYDTLLARLSPGEVDAVLAHELGHFKHRHILKRIVSLFGLSLAGLALLGWLSPRAGSTPGWACSRTWMPPMTHWPCCCSCWPGRRSASCCHPCWPGCRAGTSSRPTPMPPPRPAARTWPAHCSSCMKTMLRP